MTSIDLQKNAKLEFKNIINDDGNDFAYNMKMLSDGIVTVTSSDLRKIHRLYACKKCDFKCSKTSEWHRHILTLKHTNTYKKNACDAENAISNIRIYECICGNIYKHRQSLNNHKKKCEITKGSEPIQESVAQQTHIPNSVYLSNEVILQLINQNKELQLMLIEQNNKMCELANQNHSTNLINNNSNNTTNNTQFNLNVFLNETCKDALNISEFVESLDVKMCDLEETGRLGYSEGISKIFIKGLKELEIHKRPIHCSDFKREVLYVKDNNVWEKEDEDKSRITLAIKQVGHKNVKRIMEWQKLHPEYNDPKSKQSSQFNKLLSNVMSGSTVEEQADNMNKIIKNVTREVVINKRNFSN